MGYNKQCWSCGKVTMVSKGNYSECSECGATWNSLPTLGMYFDVVSESGGQDGRRKLTPKVRRGRIKGGPPLKPLLRPSDKGYSK